MMSNSGDRERRWTFLTNHAHALVCIAGDPGIRIQEIANRVGITLRAAQGIVNDLVSAGYVTRTRVGRRNRYEIHPELPFRHPLEHDHQVGELLEAIGVLPPAARENAFVRKDVREFIRRLEATGLEVESTPGHYRVLRDGKPLRRANGMPFMLPFSPDTTRWRRAAIVELRKLGIDV